MIIGWKSYFARRILERGEDYAYSGAVHDIKQTRDLIKAEVDGTETYHVRIELEENEVMDMYCSCPYAMDGHNCKHMAAVLYTIEDLPDEEILMEGRTEAVGVRELLEDAGPEEMREFILRQAQNDVSFANLVRISFGHGDQYVDETALIREADLIMMSCTEDYYIDEEDEDSMLNGLYRFRNEKLQPLAEKGICMPVFRTTWHILNELDKIDMDSSYGGNAFSFAGSCTMIWETILEHCSEQEKESIRTMLQRRADSEMDSESEKFVEDHFWDHEMAVRKLAELDELIDTAEPGNTYWQLRMDDAVPERFKWMKRAGASDEEITAYKKDHWHLRTVRSIALSEAKTMNNTAEIERILLDDLEYDRGNTYSEVKDMKELIALYHETGDTAKEKQYLQSLLMRDERIDLNDVRRLKELCAADEWNRRINSILKINTNEQQKCMIFAEEKRIDELFEVLKKTNDHDLLDQYRTAFPHEYDKEILKLYESQLDMMAYGARKSKAYSEMERRLNIIIGYEEGKQMARRLARKWVSEYPGRRAMADMLKKYR
ncbi:MAG: SWIM zinc finger family protein [Solobacterium sp.]|nr:SWIM zinc finger family protein [Solobacterium sp.]